MASRIYVKRIYVKFAKPKTVKDFLKEFFSAKNVFGHPCSVTTYSDKECKIIQCGLGRRRSLEDLFTCVKTYFPSVTLKTLMKELVSLRPRGQKLYPYYCSTIHRPVIIFDTIPPARLPTGVSHTNSKSSWPSALARIGIYTIEQLNNYQK
jgi:hypothetical protein